MVQVSRFARHDVGKRVALICLVSLASSAVRRYLDAVDQISGLVVGKNNRWGRREQTGTLLRPLERSLRNSQPTTVGTTTAMKADRNLGMQRAAVGGETWRVLGCHRFRRG